jgi:uncharacterized membrane protein YhaH (DUF805 family)
MQPSLAEFLFSAKGRISRSQFWLKWVLPYVVVTLVLFWGLSMVLEPMTASVVLGIYLLAALWPSLAIYIKRAHDRGRSGWFVLLLIVPILNIWALVEFMFLPGTAGSNSYGADPATV